MKKALIAQFQFILLGLLTNIHIFANPSNVKIQLNGYNPNTHKNFVDIIIPDVNYPYKEQIKISQAGTVDASLLLSATKEVIFSYDNRKIPFIIRPGDNIEVKFKIDEILSLGSEIHADVSGLNQEANVLILSFHHLIENWISNSHNALDADNSLKELNYRSLREQVMNEQLKKLQDLITEHKIDDQLFIDWAESKIKYAAGCDLCRYPFLGKINKTINETDEYFDFIKSYYPKNEFVTFLESYSTYLTTLTRDFEIIKNISEKYAPERSRLSKDSLSNFPIVFKMVSSRMEGKQREIALLHLFLNSKNIPPSYIDSIGKYVPKDRLKKVKTENDFYTTSIVDLLDKFDLKKEEKEPLLKLYQSAKGKIVFHDFWFLGCAPCMAELPYYSSLIEKAGNEVEFIFYGVYMDEEKWKNAIKKYQLKGKHYLLTKNQIAFFEYYFKLNGFPHHEVLNKKGVLINDHLPAVNPGNYDLLLSLFRKIASNGD